MIAYWAEGSIRFISGRLRASLGSTATRAAKVTGRSYVAAQSLSSVCTPDFPARAAAHVLGTSPPSGVVAPMPVTTTSGSLVTVPPGQVVGGSSSPRAGGWAVRGVRGASDGLVGRRTSPARSVLRARDEGHGVADGGEVLDLVVGDADRELLLGEGDDRHHRQGVDVEVVGEGLLRRDGVSGQPGLLADDLGQAGQDLLLAVRHRCLLVRWCRCRKAPGRARGQLVGTLEGARVMAVRPPGPRRRVPRRSRSAGRGRRCRPALRAAGARWPVGWTRRTCCRSRRCPGRSQPTAAASAA